MGRGTVDTRYWSQHFSSCDDAIIGTYIVVPEPVLVADDATDRGCAFVHLCVV